LSQFGLAGTKPIPKKILAGSSCHERHGGKGDIKSN
jgi:hypothetical protein